MNIFSYILTKIEKSQYGTVPEIHLRVNMLISTLRNLRDDVGDFGNSNVIFIETMAGISNIN